MVFGVQMGKEVWGRGWRMGKCTSKGWREQLEFLSFKWKLANIMLHKASPEVVHFFNELFLQSMLIFLNTVNNCLWNQIHQIDLKLLSVHIVQTRRNAMTNVGQCSRKLHQQPRALDEGCSLSLLQNLDVWNSENAWIHTRHATAATLGHCTHTLLGNGIHPQQQTH